MRKRGKRIQFIRNLFTMTCRNEIAIPLVLFLVFSFLKCILTLPFRGIYILGDEAFYLQTAKTILYSMQFSNPGNPYPPGYSLIIAPTQIALPNFDFVYHAVLIANSFISSLVVFPAYYISRKFLERRTSAFLAVLILVLPLTFIYSFTVMSENLFIPLYVMSCWIVLEAFSRNESMWWAICGFFLFLLLFTRTTGIAALGALLIVIMYDVCQSKDKFSNIFSKWPIALSFVLPLIFYNVYKTFSVQKTFNLVTGGLSGYSSEKYIDIIQSWILADPYTFLIVFCRIIWNELGYYLFSGFIVVIIFSLFGFCYSKGFRSNEESKAFNILFLYSVITSIGFILLSSIHLAAKYAPYGYTLLMGRYLEPTIPVIFIIGIIGYSHYSQLSIKKWTYYGLLIAIFSLIFYSLTIFFPFAEYRWINTLMVLDLQIVQKIQIVSGINGFSLLLVIMFITGVGLILIRNVNCLILVGILLSIISLMVIYPYMLNMNIYNANKMDDTSEIANILATTEKNDVIAYDRDLAKTTWGIRLFYKLFWWANGKTSWANEEKNFTYLVSDRQLPYESLVFSKKLNITLYKG